MTMKRIGKLNAADVALFLNAQRNTAIAEAVQQFVANHLVRTYKLDPSYTVLPDGSIMAPDTENKEKEG